MRRQNRFFGLIHSMILVFAIGFGWASSVLAEETPASTPTVQEEQGSQADSDAIQERGIRRMPIGGVTRGRIRGTMDPVGFSCDAKTKTCSCRKSKTGDCKLMLAIVCGGSLNCPGSSQTCTCAAMK